MTWPSPAAFGSPVQVSWLFAEVGMPPRVNTPTVALTVSTYSVGPIAPVASEGLNTVAPCPWKFAPMIGANGRLDDVPDACLGAAASMRALIAVYCELTGSAKGTRTACRAAGPPEPAAANDGALANETVSAATAAHDAILLMRILLSGLPGPIATG